MGIGVVITATRGACPPPPRWSGSCVGWATARSSAPPRRHALREGGEARNREHSYTSIERGSPQGLLWPWPQSVSQIGHGSRSAPKAGAPAPHSGRLPGAPRRPVAVALAGRGQREEQVEETTQGRSVSQVWTHEQVQALHQLYLQHPELAPEALAGQHGLSRSGMYRLFEREGLVGRRLRTERGAAPPDAQQLRQMHEEYLRSSEHPWKVACRWGLSQRKMYQLFDLAGRRAVERASAPGWCAGGRPEWPARQPHLRWNQHSFGGRFCQMAQAYASCCVK